MLSYGKKLVFISLGWLALVLGIIGIFLPIMPSTPFAILAAYFFSKGSTRMHRWLLSRPVFGPMIFEWETHGVIRPRAKWLSTIGILALFSSTLIFVEVLLPVKIIVLIIGIAVLAFIWSRPSQKPPIPPEAK